MNKIIFCFSFISLPLMALAPQFQFPRICGWTGQPVVESPGVVPKSLTKKSILKDRAHLVTGANETLCIEMAAKSFLLMKAQTEIDLVTKEDSDKIADLFLKQGQFFFLGPAPENILVRTPIFRAKIIESQGLSFNFSPDTGLGGVQVFDGKVDFRPLENEVTSPLSSGEALGFQAEIRDGEIQFDDLLKGLRAVRGTLQPKTKAEAKGLSEMKDFLTSLVPKPKTKVEIEKETAGQVCKKPPGDFDQCLFTLISSRGGPECEMRRCNANGVWANPVYLGDRRSSCKPKPFVGSCL